MKRYLIALIIAGVNCSACADEPPSWSEFSVKSANSRFTASVSKSDDGNKSHPGYRIQVQTAGDNGIPNTIWAGPYQYDGYAGGILSDHGKYFVYVDYWYRHALIISQMKPV